MKGEAVRRESVVELFSMTTVFMLVGIRWIEKGIRRRKHEICKKSRIICLFFFFFKIWMVRIHSPTPV